MEFSKEMYPKLALLKSAYAFTDRAYVHLDADELYYYVEIRPKPGCQAVNEDDFVNEMLCQSVRHEVYQKTHSLRELLVARALASTVIRVPEKSTELQMAVEGSEADEISILEDWFEVHGDA